MWFRKKAPVFLECVGCGCLMWQARREVKVECSGYTDGLTIVTYPGSLWRSTESYCGRCAPPYNTRVEGGAPTRFFRTEPSKNIEVTEKGKVVKGGA